MCIEIWAKDGPNACKLIGHNYSSKMYWDSKKQSLEDWVDHIEKNFPGRDKNGFKCTRYNTLEEVMEQHFVDLL